MSYSHTAVILSESNVETPMQAVLDCPVPTCYLGESLCVTGKARNEVPSHRGHGVKVTVTLTANSCESCRSRNIVSGLVVAVAFSQMCELPAIAMQRRSRWNWHESCAVRYPRSLGRRGRRLPWDDPEFSERMLREHLSQDHDMASRRQNLIDLHVFVDQ